MIDYREAKQETYDKLIEYGIATEEELQLVTTVCGYREEILNDVIYARTGYRSIEQYEESERW